MEEILIEIMRRKFKLVGNFVISKLIFNSSKIVKLNIYFSKITEIFDPLFINFQFES
jgi:hypothetical protein